MSIGVAFSPHDHAKLAICGPWAREMLAVLLGAEPSLRVLGALRAGLRT